MILLASLRTKYSMLPPISLEDNKLSKKGLDKAFLLRIVFALVMAFIVEHIELVYIRPSTILKYKGIPNASVQNELLIRILDQHPKAVVYDFNLDETSGSIEDKNQWEDTIISHPNVFVGTSNTPMKGEESQLYLRDPLEKVKAVPYPKTSDNLNFAKDRVSRRIMLTYQNSPMLQVQLAAMFNPAVANPDNIRGRFNFYDTDQSYIDYGRPGAFSADNFEGVTATNANLSRFKDKIVLIGTDLELDETQYAATPFDRKPSAMPRAELQANAIETLIRNSGPIKAPPFINWILIALVSLLTVHVVLTSKPAQGLLIVGGTILSLMLMAYIAFWPFGIWLTIAQPLLAIFLCYYFFIPYRLIVENRRSWEYYQKNKLLSQVEELKSNFISMMSHDLKTPIARIQGMSDVILTDATPLSSQQREAVDTIKHSSDDLLKFINAILNYGRIESEGVQLHLQSRDINQLLKDVIRKHEFLAKIKRIQIVSELEPLFPISVDPELMKQVLSNLIENAIKYSPEDTKILVSSEERDNKIVVQVADQGPGIPPEELSNIFMKFFRSKNTKSSPIKGSGLGLYLAKYFTELHKGAIFVESSIGNGSTFTVELPIEQGGLNA